MFRNTEPSTLTFHVRPSDAGQFVEVAYAFDSENDRLVKRITTLGLSRSSYAFRAMPKKRFEPWNNDPAPRSGWTRRR
jgi:hypothetical protein